MNSSGPPGIPELIPRGAQHIINIGRVGGITTGRHSLPGTIGGHGGGLIIGGSNQGHGGGLLIGGGNQGHGGGLILGSGNQGQVQANPPIRRPGTTPGKLMRLRCRFRPLHDAYIKNGVIVEDDADVIFVCGDGHQLKAHKVIMASSSKFFAKVFEDHANQTAVVSVPDVKVDVMKLILQLTYRDRVFLTMRQIKDVGDFITNFGMAWSQFGYEPYSGDEPMSSVPMPPVPMKPVELPRGFLNSPQQQPQVAQKVQNRPGRLVLQQNVNNGNDEDEDGYQIEMGQQGQNPNERHSRKSRLTPRAGTEGEDIVAQDEEDDPGNMIRDWMSKLGKRDSASSMPPSTTKAGSGSGAVKKRVRDDEDDVDVEEKPKFICSVCRQQFKGETAWRWHEERHVGHKMFKCKFCDELNATPKECWLHERDTHGFSGLNFTTPAPNPAQIKPQNSPQRPNQSTGGAARFANSPGQMLSKRIKLSTMKKVQAQKKKPVGAAGTKLSQIGIGESNGAEQLDLKKLKQLHWLYVCERCENCADSASKATLHYNRCFPNKEKPFEDTVMKYRQGFYGKSHCPLCPRRYPQNSGFMIHCGHQHQQYRKLFTHISGADDQLKCNNCKEKFDGPTDFHEHLEKKGEKIFYCGEEPTDEVVQEASAPVTSKPAPATRSSSEGKVSRPRLPRRPESPMESKASYKVQFHTPPRSARLASRVQAEASAEAAKAKATDINFPPVDCPVCGDSDLPNISVHLQTKHKDLNVDVTRISSELLRCKGCTITFDVCDLLDHKNCLNQQQEAGATSGGDGEESNSSTSTGGGQRRSSSSGGAAATTAAAAAKPAKPAPIIADPESLPPGVGRSPIEKIEMDDLLSIDAIRSALKCLICGNTAKRLGVIADCLRTHGIHRCALCFNSYCSKTDYTIHLKKCHGSGPNKLKCPLCVKSFANAGQTSGHMYATHWQQILKQMDDEANNGDVKKEEDVKPPTIKAAGDSSAAANSNNDGDGDNSLDQDDDEKEEKIEEEEEDDNQAEVRGIVESVQEEEDDDEEAMEIDESPQSDEASSPDKDAKVKK